MLGSNASSDGTVISMERQNAKKAVVHIAHSKGLLWSGFHLLRIPLIFHRMPRVIGRHPALPCELPILPHKALEQRSCMITHDSFYNHTRSFKIILMICDLIMYDLN